MNIWTWNNDNSDHEKGLPSSMSREDPLGKTMDRRLLYSDLAGHLGGLDKLLCFHDF